MAGNEAFACQGPSIHRYAQCAWECKKPSTAFHRQGSIMRSYSTAACLVLVCALVVLCSQALFADEPSNSPRLFAPGVISGAADDMSPAFTPDGNTVFFSRGNDSGSVILESHREKGEWSRPVIASFSGTWNDLEPAMAPDGSFLVFASNRPADHGTKPIDGNFDGKAFPALGGNLWRVDRQGAGWGTPKRLPDAINADTGTFSPSVAADGSIYFMRPAKSNGRFALYRSQYRDGSYQAATPMSVGDATTEDVDPAIAPDESFIVYSSNHPDRHDHKRLQIAFRQNGNWGIPIDLGNEVNEEGSNIESRLGSDHSTLYFSTNTVPPASFPRPPGQADRSLAQMQVWADGRENIWYVTLKPWLDSHRK
ncbi:TolB family protein [Dyella choica]|uniref:TolB family protein n=1 Tax=Dyella choica TaxID=1927959 RepID=UPI00131575D7|nr:PD40 domain-containing protein [Dyella choica]